jgi:endonuclease-8
VPEGDTIHRAAARMRPALEGRRLVRFEAPRLVGDRPRAGELIEGVEARGKHLLVHFEGGLTLRTHMRMTGSWHLYRAGERWRKGPHLARAVVEADSGWLAVCFQAPVVETYHRSAGEPLALAGLGPDLTGPDPDLDAVLERAATIPAPSTEVADVLLDQRVASGIGNVYKSEVLFLHGLDPFTPVSVVDADRLRRIYATAHELLRANLGSGRRVTYRGGVAVYARRGQECFRCGTPVRMRYQGPMARSTYWCPSCQRPPDAHGPGGDDGRSVAPPPVRE